MYIPSVLTILGVILYLRMGWVVGHSGLPLALLIVTVSSAITLITGLSIAGTATNMRVRVGGAYYMVSRSYGVEWGAAVGLPLYLAQAMGVAFYVVGFAESVHRLVPGVSVTALALASLAALTVPAYLSADLALKAQVLIFAVIAASLGSIFLGGPPDVPAPLPPPEAAVPFWTVFAVFFPAVTGILSGLSMSGDLRDPGRALPRGTIAAVLTGYAVYMAVPVLLWAWVPAAVLRAEPMVLWEVALVPHLVYAGIWGATLSSGLGSLLAAPRTLQALANDGLLPRFLGRGFGPRHEPRIATMVSFAIAAAAIALGSLDGIAPVLTMFFLTTYGTLNLITGLEGLIESPSWRPAIHTPWALALVGAFLCLATMLMIDAGATLLAAFVCTAAYLYAKRRKLRVSWPDLRGALLLSLARFTIYALSRYQENARTWRPNLLVLSGAPTTRWHLISLGNALSHGKGFLTVASILHGESGEADKRRELEQAIGGFLDRHRVPGLVRVKYAEDLTAGVSGLLTDYGLGHVTPNTVVMGDTRQPERAVDYCRTLLEIHRSRRNALIVRAGEAGEGEPGEPLGGSRIEIWLAHISGNATLMILLAHLLQTSTEWQGAEITLRSLAYSEDERDGLAEGCRRFLQESRIQAEVSVSLIEEGRNAVETLVAGSAGADLVFLGMRRPEPEESAEDYARYYDAFMARLQPLGLAVLTLAGQDIDFGGRLE